MKKTNDDLKVLKKCFDDVVWMAIRYADGRHTYAPDMVKCAINEFKKVFPDWELKEDITIKTKQKL
ncbi:hypothetical protein [uncultured Lutibacter sp.]|jgi:hypothetical protein|uniref:hypothetical protein n=1 Tax=uncultured Lutibacter sp. TaxID=437739 RepID=UPI002638BFB8|nr:hypothetical protein [uncultured Lutibacter sp.]